MSLGHLIRRTVSKVREAVKRRVRSPHWPRVEKQHLLNNPECAACPGREHLQVHHVRPFHEYPDMELSPSNLITLCMGPQECHLRVGHRGSWKDANPRVRRDAALLKKAWKP